MNQLVGEFKELGKYVNMEEIDELALVSKKKTNKLTKLMTMQVEVRKRRKEDENKEKLQRRILLKELRAEIKRYGVFQTIKARVNGFREIVRRNKDSRLILVSQGEFDFSRLKEMLEEHILPSGLSQGSLATNTLLHNYFKVGLSKCLEIVASFLTNPYDLSLSEKFIESHEQLDDNAFPKEFFECTSFRSYQKFLIPNTEEMKKLLRIMSIAFDTVVNYGDEVLSESELVSLGYCSRSRNCFTFGPTMHCSSSLRLRTTLSFPQSTPTISRSCFLTCTRE